MANVRHFYRWGAIEPLLPNSMEGNDPTWSPDGNSVLFAPLDLTRNPGLRILDLRTRHVSVVSGSEGFYSPRWLPNGQYISALSEDGDRLILFNVNTGKWTKESKMSASSQSWSRDGKYVFFASAATEPGIFRVSIKDNKLERMVDLKGFRAADTNGWFSLTPEDEPLLLRELGGRTELYALQWQAP